MPLTGCFEPKPQQTIYKETSDTIASVFSENDAGGTGLPFGVTLQIDPSVLIPCELERVVDGDTIIVHDPDNNRLRVRLTGINAPESVLEDESKNTDEGRDASKFLKELLADVKTVYLEYDEGQFDQYGRTLAYVWIDTGTTYIMVNEVILATGHAKPVYIKPNLRYADTFRLYETDD
ncbi:MAG: thermonuclease family protein [Clostridiales bacterium]|nr:thermonuclease family protein [Clostridiales bacterium]